jgi:Cellulase (glycosyl hydrolase family 5)
MGVRIALATVALALACAAPARAAETGVNDTLHNTLPLPQTAGKLGADWVRLWMVWADMEQAPGSFDQHRINVINGRIAGLQARGIKVLVVVHGAPSWASGGGGGPPANAGAFGRFMGEIAQRVPGADAWEMWNEPDSAQFWGGAPDPAAYAALLRAAYPAIKAVQPGDIVVTGGMVGNNMDFLSAIYQHGAQGSFDAVGVHTDTACLTSGPDAYYRDERGRVGRYTFSGYREVHAVMTDHGDGAKPVWMTELGWNTQRGRCNVGEKAGKKRLGVSPRRQARLLRAAYRCLAADPFLSVAIWFGLQDVPATRHARGFGLYRRSKKAKPAARAFRRLERGIRPRRGCGGYVDRTPPTISVRSPRDGVRFRDKISVRVRAADNPGGSGIGRISMALDGQHVRSWGGSGGSIAPWWGSADWTPGVHTLTFSVRDRAMNPATVSVRVEKLRRR